jgi:glycosyltransferase involved in cell wall biosynthesis
MMEVQKRKILVFISASYVSGFEVVTLHLIRQLQQRGHDVRCVVNGWNDGVFKEQLDEGGIPWYEVKLGWLYVTKPWWTLDTLAHWPKAYSHCSKILRDFDPDICHFCPYANVIMLYPLLKGRKSVYNLQETHEPSKTNLWIYGLLNRRIDIFTAVSGHIVKTLRNLHIPTEKIRLVYNGVPVLPVASPGFRPGRTPVLAIIGQVASWKGHETLVDAAGILARSGEPADFVVAIFGNDKNDFAASLKTRIARDGLERYFVWKGFLQDQAAIYDQVDIVVVPSLSQEPCSLTILESMMRSKALIVSDRGGNPELVDDEINGLIYPAENAGKLATCIRLLLQDPLKAAGMAESAGAKARKSFTDSTMADAYIQAYTELWN